MAKTGRPRKGEAKAETTQVRVSPELAELLSDLALVHPLSTAQLLDQFALPDVRELHGQFKELIDQAKMTNENAAAKLLKLKEEAARVEREKQGRASDAAKRPQDRRPKL